MITSNKKKKIKAHTYMNFSIFERKKKWKFKNEKI